MSNLRQFVQIPIDKIIKVGKWIAANLYWITPILETSYKSIVKLFNKKKDGKRISKPVSNQQDR